MGKGIDYGMGLSNIDYETGIRYGVISIHEVLQAWADESEGVYACTECPEYDHEKKECKEDFPDCTPFMYEYDENGFHAEQIDETDIFITKSKYYTLCGYCSPCAPGAGYLTSEGDIKAYCFGHDWFEDGRAPYKVYSVETGEEVLPVPE